jgi:hypothetical protein
MFEIRKKLMSQFTVNPFIGVAARLRWKMILDASAATSSNRSEPMLYYCCLDQL